MALPLYYTDRLKLLNLESLESRQIKSDITTYYEILNGLIDIKETDFFAISNSTQTRGHPWKLLKQRTLSNTDGFSFANRIVNIWNNLPLDLVCYKTLTSFKSNLRKLNVVPFTSRPF
jgi:hypothetical protein